MTGMEVYKVESTQVKPIKQDMPDKDASVTNKPLPVAEGNESDGVNTTPPKSHQFNYKNFPSSSRDVAVKIVNETISDVDKAVRNQTGENRYVVDYNDFPNPADYKMDGLSKQKQFDAWKDDVTAWKNKHLDEINRRNQTTIDNLNENINRLRDNVIQGFLITYAELKLTREEMTEMYNALSGDVEQMKAQLNKKMNELKQSVKDMGTSLNNEIKQEVIQGFLITYAELELTRAEMTEMYNALSGDVEQMKAQLDKKMNELKQSVKNMGTSLKNEIKQEAGNTRKWITINEVLSDEKRERIGELKSKIIAQIRGTTEKRKLATLLRENGIEIKNPKNVIAEIEVIEDEFTLRSIADALGVK